jgi:hypothetical protein
LTVVADWNVLTTVAVHDGSVAFIIEDGTKRNALPVLILTVRAGTVNVTTFAGCMQSYEYAPGEGMNGLVKHVTTTLTKLGAK